MSMLPLSTTSENPIVNKLSASFKSWLVSQNYNPNTVRNYLADVNKYLSSAADLSPESLISYLDSISSDVNFSRYFSSLNLFCRYALDQNLISSNPLSSYKKTNPVTSNSSNPAFEALLTEFQSYLQRKGKSSSTIRNYINDVQQYFDFVTNLKQVGH